LTVIYCIAGFFVTAVVDFPCYGPLEIVSVIIIIIIIVVINFRKKIMMCFYEKKLRKRLWTW